ncbi:MAG: metal-dependent hydrolase [Candidatus Micrarchaeota archaeon]
MNWRSHAIIGAICAVLVLYALGTREIVEFGLIAILGALSALAPDLDHDMSKGRKILDVGVVIFSLAILYLSTCKGTFCVPTFSMFIIWLGILGVYFLLFRFFKPHHRGITHTIVAAVVFGVILYLLLDLKFALVGLVGYLSHLLADKVIKLI